MTAGDYEFNFKRTVKRIADEINGRGGLATVKFYPAGHDSWMWRQAFQENVRDWLSSQSRSPVLAQP